MSPPHPDAYEAIIAGLSLREKKPRPYVDVPIHSLYIGETFIPDTTFEGLIPLGLRKQLPERRDCLVPSTEIGFLLAWKNSLAIKTKESLSTMPIEIILDVVDALEDPIDAYAFVIAVSPCLDNYWENARPKLTKSINAWFNFSFNEDRIKNLYVFHRHPNYNDNAQCFCKDFVIQNGRAVPHQEHQGRIRKQSHEWYTCYTLAESDLWHRLLYSEVDIYGEQFIENMLQHTNQCYPRSRRNPELSTKAVREWILDWIFSKLHDSSLRTLQDALYSSKDYSALEYVAINLNFAELRKQQIEYSKNSINERLLLTMQEFIPIVRNILLLLCNEDDNTKVASWPEPSPDLGKKRDCYGDSHQGGQKIVGFMRLNKRLHRNPSQDAVELVARWKARDGKASLKEFRE